MSTWWWRQQKGFKNAQKSEIVVAFHEHGKRLIISITVFVLTWFRYPRKQMKNSVSNNPILPGLLKPCWIWSGVGGIRLLSTRLCLIPARNIKVGIMSLSSLVFWLRQQISENFDFWRHNDVIFFVFSVKWTRKWKSHYDVMITWYCDMILLFEIMCSKLVSFTKLQLNMSINNQIIYKVAFLRGKCPEASFVVWSLS